MTRPRLIRREEPVADGSTEKFFPSGSTLLDLGLGGGWARDRIINIVGDTSSGKTLKAIEAAINFAALYGDDAIRYNETEAAFDRSYAYSLGFPAGASFVGDDSDAGHGSRTVQEFYADLEKFIERRRGEPSLYILDSVDAMSDDAEMGRELGEATYGMGKPKLLSEFFRKHVKMLAQAHCTLMTISQIRDKIGVTFGETKARSGGHALDFYASQIVWLYEGGKIKKQVDGIDKIIGIKVRYRVKKNKLAAAHAEAEQQILFNYGIDDETSMIDWLKKVKLNDIELTSINLDRGVAALARLRRNRDMDTLRVVRHELQRACRQRWQEIADAAAPPVQKYS